MTPTLAIVFVIVCVFVFFGLVAFIGAPYVPSQRKYVRRAFDYFGIDSNDVLVDVGSGDGVVLRLAASRGARAIGYEINPVLVLISKLLSFGDKKVTVLLQNFWTTNLPDATTIVYAFAVERDERKLIGMMQRHADRLNGSIKLLCLGSPFRSMKAADTFEAYHLYVFHPLQPKKA